jgi:DNA-binding NarL/FixJ family response regulator
LINFELMIRVLIYDDSEDTRTSIVALIGLSEGFVSVGTFADALHVETQLDELKPDVVLMDINMPGMNGIDATRLIKSLNPNTKVLIQTAFDNDEHVFGSLKAGAEGYLLKSASPDKILKGIEDVYNGGAIMTPSIALRVMRFFQPIAKPSNPYNLTNREKTVLELLSDGLSYKMIAARLEISYFTVNAHIRKIYEKLHVNSSAEAVSLALKSGIV